MANVRDCMGKTESYHLGMFPNTSASELKQISLKEQDWESGYNAFHLAMSTLQLQKSFKLYERCINDSTDKGKSWQMKDRSGMTPLLLLESMLMGSGKLGTKPVAAVKDHTFEKCYNFGSNVNMQLGTGDNNDRMFVWYEIDPWKMAGNDLRFLSCVMTKYHSILMMVNNDGVRSCYVTGNASTGRILHERDVLRYSYLPLLNPVKICASNHHTVALLSNETLAVWGSNRYGQLNLNPKIADFVNEPRILNLGTNLSSLFGCSAVHTSVLLQNGQLKSFGLDLGQMGTTSKYDKNIPYLDGKGKLTHNLLTTELPSYIYNHVSLVCTEFVTFILCSGNRIFAISNHKIIKVNVTLSSNDPFDKFFVRSFYHHKILDIKCKNSHGKFLSLLYDDGTVATIPDFRVNSLPIAYWTPKYSWDKCVSFDVGVEGQLILATKKGDIYSSLSQGKKFTKIKSGAAGSPMCAVHCDSMFASFNVLHDVSSLEEAPMVEIELKKQKLERGHDVIFHSSLKETFTCHKAILASAQPLFVQTLLKDGVIEWNLGREQLVVRLDQAKQSCWNIYLESTDAFAEYLKKCVSSYYALNGEMQLKLNCQEYPNFIDHFHLPSALSRPPSLQENIRKLFDDSSTWKPNTKIELADNKVFYSQSFVLALHSSFYERLFSEVWANGKSSFVLDWTDVSYESCYSLLGYIHGCESEILIPLNKDLSIGHSKYVEHLLDVLELANKYMFEDFKEHLESILCDSIDFTNVISYWIISNQLFCPTLGNKCEEYILHDPGVLFDSEYLNIMMENVTENMWQSLESKFKDFFNQKIPTKSWYQESDAKKWIKMFGKDLKEFNGRFMNPENEFELVIDVIKSKRIRRKTSGLSGRKSSFVKIKKNNPSETDLVNIRRPSASSDNIKTWAKNIIVDSDSAIDDDDQSEFISVTHRKARRASSVASSYESVNVRALTNVQPSNVSDRKKSVETIFPVIGESTSKSTAASKIIIKKQTQKERIRRITAEGENKSDQQNTKTVWGKSKKEASGSKDVNNSGIKSPAKSKPIQSSSINFPTLQEAMKMGKKSTGIISTTGDGTKPTMPLYLNKNNSLSWSAPPPSGPPVKSMQDALEEARFMKWWEEESKKVQAEQNMLQEISKVGTRSKHEKDLDATEMKSRKNNTHRKQNIQGSTVSTSKKQQSHKKNATRPSQGIKKSKMASEAIFNS